MYVAAFAVMLNADFPNSVLEGNQSTCWALIFMNDMEIYYCVPPLTHYAWNRVLVPCEVHEPVHLSENGFTFTMASKWCASLDHDIRVL